MRPLAVLCFLLLLPLLSAQESRKTQDKVSEQGRFLEWKPEDPPGHIFLDLKNKSLILINNVNVRFGGITLRCKNLYAWGALEPKNKKAADKGGKKDPLEQARHLVREIYAEGNVVITEGDKTFRFDRAYLDLVHERGLLDEGTLRLPIRTPTGELPLMVRAGEVRILALNRIQAFDTRITTSPFIEPSFNIRSDQIELIRDRPGIQGEEGNEKEVVNTNFTAEGNTLYHHNLPVFWFPDLGGDTAAGNIFQYLKNVRYRKSNRFGHEAEVFLGDELKAKDGTSLGNWTILLDYLSKRGFGGGVDVEYETKIAEGRVIIRYQRDHGRDNFFGTPTTKNRGRGTIWHRQRLPGDVIIDLEMNLFSDRGFLPTYYESEFKSAKPSENLLYVKKPLGNGMLSATATGRFNNWLTRTEYLPEVRYDLIREPLFDVLGNSLYLGTTTRVGHARRLFDDSLGIRSRDTFRTDVDTLFELPILAGPLKLTPFGGVRYTYFEQDLSGKDSQDRLGYTFGATLSTQMWKTFEAEGGIFDLDGLRHVVMPEITFRNTVGVNIFPGDLVQFDDIDTLDNEQVVEFRLRNILQTVRRRQAGDFVDTVVDLETRINYFPNARRDNMGRSWGNIDNDFLIRFGGDLQISADSEYDLGGNGFEVFNTSIGITPTPQVQTFAGFRHFENTYDVVFLQGNWQPEEKWLLSLETSYDLSQDRGIEHRFSVARISDDWVLRISLKADIGENDFGIGLSFSPRLLFDPLLTPRALRREPRFLYLGNGIQH